MQHNSTSYTIAWFVLRYENLCEPLEMLRKYG